jgi:hypothetical protein
MAKKNLNLNTLSRYSKQSPRLVLEEHGHCEVPAGCGGVVLRWRNPKQSTTVVLWLHTNGDADFLLDGEKPSSSNPLITYGDHVLSLRILRFLPGQGLLMFAGIYDEEEMVHTDVKGGSHEKIQILSKPDGTWRYSLTEPSDNLWIRSGFDDSFWMPMIHKPLLEPGEQDGGSYCYKRLMRYGASGLGIQDTDKSGTVWIRKSFNLSLGNI